MPMKNPSYILIFLMLLLVVVGCTGEGTDEVPEPADAQGDQGDSGLLDAGTGACSTDDDCEDFSSCTQNACVEGQCRFTRQAVTPTVRELMTIPEDVVAFELVGSLLYLAKGAAGAQVWNIDEVPPRKLAEVTPAEGHEPYAGIHQYEGGFLVRSGRKIYIYGDNGGQVRGEYRAADEVRDVMRLGESQVVLGLYSRGIEVVEIGAGQILDPERKGRVDTLGRAERLASVEDSLLVADGLLGVSLVSLADPETPLLNEFTVRTEGRVDRLASNGRRVAILEAGAGVGLLAVRNGEASRLMRLPIDAEMLDIGLSDLSTMLVFTRAQGVLLYDVSIPASPWLWDEVDLGQQLLRVGRSERGYVLLRADRKVVHLELSCGPEGDLFAVPFDAGTVDGGLDSGVDGDAVAP